MPPKVEAVFQKYAKEIGLYKFHRDALTGKITIRTELRASWQFKMDMLAALGPWKKMTSFLLLTVGQIEKMKIIEKSS